MFIKTAVVSETSLVSSFMILIENELLKQDFVLGRYNLRETPIYNFFHHAMSYLTIDATKNKTCGAVYLTLYLPDNKNLYDQMIKKRNYTIKLELKEGALTELLHMTLCSKRIYIILQVFNL